MRLVIGLVLGLIMYYITVLAIYGAQVYFGETPFLDGADRLICIVLALIVGVLTAIFGEGLWDAIERVFTKRRRWPWD